MLLSIVSGTYNRLPYLQRMIESARLQMERGIRYEFVIVDGGSTDGTIEWCKTQSDVRLLEHGELRGAIAAFCDGAYSAKGEYVLLANDDVEFIDYGIITALRHLERTPECGAVAFADDRPAKGYPDGFKVQVQNYRKDGERVQLPYAQVGLYRRWLGDMCLWWGADDPDFHARTYGGDNYLSAKIFEYGYEVHAVLGVQVRDLVVQDGLRNENVQQELQRGSAYYEYYRELPVIRDVPICDNPQKERLRILYLPIFESRIYPHHRANKRGLLDALSQVGLVYEVDYLNSRHNLCELVRAWKPHILFTQCQGEPVDLISLRAMNPDMLVWNWNGDVHEAQLTSPEMLLWLRQVDLQLVVNANVLDTYAQHNIPSAYWQIGYEPVHDLPDMPSHDIVFLGSAYSDQRKQLAQVLADSGYTVGLYGAGWEHGQGNTTYEFDKGAALYKNATIAIGDNQWTDRYGFVSNRLFEALANGAFLLHQTIPGLQELTGLKDGIHYVAWKDFSDLQDKIQYYMQPKLKKERRRIRRNGRDYVRRNHSFETRVCELFTDILPGLTNGISSQD